ncbi:MAG: serine hydrolase [Opitutae bacterium]|nr:serine hydrolase [Opitutae bacterium]
MKPVSLLVFLAAGLSTVPGVSAASPLERLPRSTPEEQGISAAAILRYVDALETKVRSPHSFMLVRHGRVVAEGWWTPYAAAEPHALFSLSKSFTSTAVGLAISEGKLRVSDPVIGFFPEKAPANPSPNLQAMRVRDLLRMSSGQHGEDVDPFPFNTDQDLVRVFLAKPVAHRPGTHFFYNTAGTYMLSAIVQKVTGQTVRDYLGPRLFEPLGMADPRWDASAQGITLGGYGLSLRTEDIACFGQLYLQRGRWNGRQLVPAAWVDEATALQTANGSDPDGNWDQGYGYQFWRCPHNCYRGDGAFGQLCVVMPEADAVLVVTAGTDELGPEFNLTWEHLLPAFAGAPLQPDPAANRRLRERLAGLSLPVQEGRASSPIAADVARKQFTFADNALGLETLALVPAKDRTGAMTVECKLAGIGQRIVCGQGSWRKGVWPAPHTPPGLGDPAPIAASGAWTADDTYTVKIVRYQTPFTLQLRLRFAGNQVAVDLDQELNFGERHPVHLVGEASAPTFSR